MAYDVPKKSTNQFDKDTESNLLGQVSTDILGLCEVSRNADPNHLAGTGLTYQGKDFAPDLTPPPDAYTGVPTGVDTPQGPNTVPYTPGDPYAGKGKF